MQPSPEVNLRGGASPGMAAAPYFSGDSQSRLAALRILSGRRQGNEALRLSPASQGACGCWNSAGSARFPSSIAALCPGGSRGSGKGQHLQGLLVRCPALCPVLSLCHRAVTVSDFRVVECKRAVAQCHPLLAHLVEVPSAECPFGLPSARS